MAKNRRPVSAFKDESGYTITFDDGRFEEAPISSLRRLREVARDYGMTVRRVDGSWMFFPRKRKDGRSHAS